MSACVGLPWLSVTSPEVVEDIGGAFAERLKDLLWRRPRIKLLLFTNGITRMYACGFDTCQSIGSRDPGTEREGNSTPI